jgi:hypothetical protein
MLLSALAFCFLVLARDWTVAYALAVVGSLGMTFGVGLVVLALLFIPPGERTSAMKLLTVEICANMRAVWRTVTLR